MDIQSLADALRAAAPLEYFARRQYFAVCVVVARELQKQFSLSELVIVTFMRACGDTREYENLFE